MRDYSRLQSTAFSRDRVAALSVLVVGAGALGNEVIKTLSLLGVGRLAVVDRDRIEPSNLTRSVLFCTSDVESHLARGTPKADLAAARARELNPDVAAVSWVGEIADFGLGRMRAADLVFSCLDNEMARLELGWACARLDRPLVDGGLGLFNYSSGLVSLFPGAEGPCYACRKGTERRRELLQELQGREDPCGVKAGAQEAAALVATTPIMASIVGAFQVEVGLRYVLDGRSTVPPNEGLSYRVSLHPQPRLDALRFRRSSRCPLHQPHSVIRSVRERADRQSVEWTVAELLCDVSTDGSHQAGSGVGPGGAFLTFDWPMTVRARCESCGHPWEPFLRRARFRRAQCPACGSSALVELEVLTEISAGSPWASRSLAELGLPGGHIHEVALWPAPEAPRVHIEISGDLRTSAHSSELTPS